MAAQQYNLQNLLTQINAQAAQIQAAKNSFGPAIAESNRLRAAVIANDTQIGQLVQQVNNSEAEIARLRGIVEQLLAGHPPAQGGGVAPTTSAAGGIATGQGPAYGAQKPSNTGGGSAATVASSSASTTPRAGSSRPNTNNNNKKQKGKDKVDDPDQLPLVVENILLARKHHQNRNTLMIW